MRVAGEITGNIEGGMLVLLGVADDDTQDDANHIHSVWRDFTGDFGEDLLHQHYRASHPEK